MYNASSRHLTMVSFAGMPRRRSSLGEERHASVRAAFSSVRGQRGAGLGLFLSGIAVIAIVVLSGLLYIHQITSSAAKGYDVVSLERKVENLKKNEQQLELEAAQLQSLKTIEDSVRRLNFIHADHVAFTSPIVQGAVAYSGTAAGF